jgi:hypothetical protein
VRVRIGGGGRWERDRKEEKAKEKSALNFFNIIVSF